MLNILMPDFQGNDDQTELDQLRAYKVIQQKDSRDFPGEHRLPLFNKYQRCYYLIARKTWEKCRIRLQRECVGWLKDNTWQNGEHYAVALKSHKISLDKYHLLPFEVGQEVFESKVLKLLTGEEKSFLLSIYSKNESRQIYQCKNEIKTDTILARWDLCLRIGFRVCKFSTYTREICKKQMSLFCSRECLYLKSCRARIKNLPVNLYKHLLSNPAFPEQGKAMLKSLYSPGTTGNHRLNQDATFAQVLSLYNFLQYRTLTLKEDAACFGVHDCKDENILLSEIYTLIIRNISEFSFIEQSIFHLFMQDTPQKKISKSLRLSESNVTRRIQYMERTLTSIIRNSLEIPDNADTRISLKGLRNNGGFMTQYSQNF